MQIKTIMRYYLIAVRMAITKKTRDSKYLHGSHVSLTPELSIKLLVLPRGFSGGSDSKESTCNVGNLSSVPGLGRCPGEGKGYPLQCSGLEHSMDTGAWQAAWQSMGLQSQTWLETQSDSSLSESLPFFFGAGVERALRKHLLLKSDAVCFLGIHPTRRHSVCVSVFLWHSDLPAGSGLSVSSIHYEVPH